MKRASEERKYKNALSREEVIIYMAIIQVIPSQPDKLLAFVAIIFLSAYLLSLKSYDNLAMVG